ncbi:MAG TPA: aspartate--tRNA ligase [Firmicutes bacterium]|nr:aspartate--tRNA ligase [Bacillota bacterium]
MSETIKGLKRTHYCGEITESDIGKEVTVFGWVQRQRDLGQLIFIDLRDRTGIIQLSFDDSTDRDVFDKAWRMRSEYVAAARGVVMKRASVNTEIPTGSVEIKVSELRLLASSETTPFEIVKDSDVKEDLRLKYRYLDLRRPEMQEAIILRSKIVKSVRDYFDENGFIEIETPILIKSTPEGARDYLVPSRVHNGSFFALPQSPQLYKQLLMLSGFDRYYQVARCFRDEDLRADRQPEFTQVDIEMSFVDENDIMTVNEGLVKLLMKKYCNVDVKLPLRRITYKEAMEKYGSDKPDTRFGLELIDLADALTGCGFKVFSSALEAGGSVKAINVKGAAGTLTRKEIDKLTAWIKDYGAKGVAFTRVTEEARSSSFEKFLIEEEIGRINAKTGCETGDVLLIIADSDAKVVSASLGALRCEIARRLDLIPKDTFDLLWVTEFPLFEYNKETDSYSAMHHPFTAPMEEDIALLDSDIGSVRARAFDLVINGNEAGGGSVRINDTALQAKMFEKLGFTDEDANARFGFLIDAFKYGAPPHGGMAYGLDRVVMIMLGRESIRDVIAFPKVASSAELMSGAPDVVDKEQLDELGIMIKQD